MLSELLWLVGHHRYRDYSIRIQTRKDVEKLKGNKNLFRMRGNDLRKKNDHCVTGPVEQIRQSADQNVQ